MSVDGAAGGSPGPAINGRLCADRGITLLYYKFSEWIFVPGSAATFCRPKTQIGPTAFEVSRFAGSNCIASITWTARE